jgi:tRNA(Leu) C34 or U34 (ribose-2'-O)-methylase TrmL
MPRPKRDTKFQPKAKPKLQYRDVVADLVRTSTDLTAMMLAQLEYDPIRTPELLAKQRQLTLASAQAVLRYNQYMQEDFTPQPGAAKGSWGW